MAEDSDPGVDAGTPEKGAGLAVLLAAIACLVYLAGEVYVFGGLALPLDDGWIHLQFARQLAAGHGLTYNDPGDPATAGAAAAAGSWISGSTAPLWTALLALGFLLPGGPLVWAKVLGVGFFLATVHATGLLAAELGLGRGPRRLAAVLTAASHWLVWSALSGMEIALFSCLSLWGIVLHLRERAAPSRLPASLAVLAASALARPEGTLLLVFAIADRLVRCDRPSPDTGPQDLVVSKAEGRWRPGLLAAAVILVPTWIFYLVAGGSILPTTFAVKAGPPPDLIPSGRYLGIVLDVLFRSQPVMLLAAGAGVLRLIARLGGRRDRGLLPAAWPIGLALAYSFLASPAGPVAVGNFGRYYFPVLPVIVVLGVLGLEPAGRRLGPAVRIAGAYLPLRALAIAAILAPQLWGLAHGPPRYLQTLANVEDSDVAAARWLAPRLPAEALLAVQDIGALKYHLSNRILDLTGIVNPRILPHLHGSGPEDPVYWEERLLRYLAEEKPDYLIVFPRSYPRLTRAAGFAPVRNFAVSDNVTMAGDELVVFSTPWTRFPALED